jgi:hypothetical protein
MKKLGIALLLMLLVTAVMALPAASSEKKEPVGTRIDLFSPPITFAANTPFHIHHGWTTTPTTEAVGKFSFALDLDGTRLTADFVLKTPVSDPVPDSVERHWVFNFPAGLTGTHVFTGHFFAPCYVGPGPCDNPNEVIETGTVTRTVIFS